MIGNDERHHNIPEGEEKGCQHGRVKTRQSNNLAEDAIEEDERIVAAEQQRQGYDNLYEVIASEADECLVYEIERIDKEGKQRMTIDIIEYSPFRGDGIGDRVEARHTEVLYEDIPVVFLGRGELLEVLAYEQRMKNNEEEHRQERRPQLFTFYTEQSEISHLRNGL